MANKKIISIDFDGTIVKHKFPQIGEPLPGAFETIKLLKQAGYILVLNTCREDVGNRIDKRYLTDAVNFCKENDIEFDGINETPIEYDFRQDWPIKRKIFAHIYIDDSSIGGFLGWDKIKEILLKNV